MVDLLLLDAGKFLFFFRHLVTKVGTFFFHLTHITKALSVFVEIADSGFGMSEETAKHIFEKFYQGDRSRSTQGNGLGLALVNRVIDILNGKITVESKLNEGSKFIIQLKKD